MHACNLFVVFLVVSIYFCCAEEAKICENVDEDNLCNEPCPDGTIPYISSCEEMTKSQRTCLQPIPRDLGKFCDYSRCDCPEPLVRDEVTNKCVRLEDCSDQSNVVHQTEILQTKENQELPLRRRPDLKNFAQRLVTQFNDEQLKPYPYYFLFTKQ